MTRDVGTAIATVAARAEHDVLLYARSEVVVAGVNERHHNPHYLSKYALSPLIRATSDLPLALGFGDLLVLAIPTQAVPGWLAEHKHLISPTLLLCNTSKGLYLADKELLSEAVLRALDRDQPYALLSGPSFASEIMDGSPTAVVVASRRLYHAVTVQRMFSSLIFRCYATQDLIGVELGGALKNPLAIGAGMIEGLGMGINSMAAYVTMSSIELQSLCKAMGGEPQTISGLAGVGDLMLTAFGEQSRNRSLGKRLTQGEKLEDVTREMTVEGVPTAFVAIHFADKCGLDLPIFRTVAAILSGDMKIEDAHVHLMGRPLRSTDLIHNR